MFKIFFLAIKGTGAFRFYLQPLMATLRGIKHGRQDFQQGILPVFNRFFGDEKKRDVLNDGLQGVYPVLLLAVILDVYAQWEIFHYIYVVMTMLVILIIVLAPYFLARDITNRLSCLKDQSSKPTS